MHRLSRLKEIKGVDNARLAEMAKVDVVTLHLFERCMIPISLAQAQRISAALDEDVSALFPDVAPILTAARECGSEAEAEAVLSQPAHSHALALDGLDPDPRDWVADLVLTSGVERRYPLSSLAVDAVRAGLRAAGAPFLVFYSDCRHVIIRKEAISEIGLRAGFPHLPFSSRERAFTLTVCHRQWPREEHFEVAPDDLADGGEKPFADLVENAYSADGGFPDFIRVEREDDCERHLSLSGVELLEIPVGLISPDIYGDDDSDAGAFDAALERMRPAGSA